jgi:hypothetical protein
MSRGNGRDWKKVGDETLVRRRALAHAYTETLGSDDTCWCGEPVNHYWPGQEDGAPHPKGPQPTS